MKIVSTWYEVVLGNIDGVLMDLNHVESQNVIVYYLIIKERTEGLLY